MFQRILGQFEEFPTELWIWGFDNSVYQDYSILEWDAM
jgi:hypothetical protein